MQNLLMCRICLASDVRLCSIASSLQDMYEKLTELTFKREDRRPLVACYVCHARLRNCYRLRSSCLQSEKHLTDMLSNSELVPPQVCSTNMLRVVSVLHFSLGHALPDSIECYVKKEVLKNAELDQENSEDIKMEPQEEHDAQIDGDIQCSYLGNLLDVMKREPDDVETDAEDKQLETEDIKFKLDDIIIEENEPNGAYQSSLYNICPKIVKVVLERMVLNDTIPTTGVPAFKKLAETDSLLVMEPENVNKSIAIDKLAAISKIQKIDAPLHIHPHNKVTDQDEVHKQMSKSNICSIEKCFRSKSHLESLTGSKHGLTPHMYTHTANKPYINEICDKPFSRQAQFTANLPTHTGVKRFQCDICSKCFTSKSNLTQHQHTHTGEKSFQCDICNKCYTFKSNLKRHLHTHTGEKLFQCEVCYKCFTIQRNLARHMYIHSKQHERKEIKCDMCNKCFTSKSSLTQHIYIHTREKRFQCDICSKCFTSKFNLTQHQYTHTGEKPFQCDMCNKCFTKKSNLTLHLMTHTNEKRFQCDTCNKFFRTKSNLKGHLFIHTHARKKLKQKLPCDVCNKCFCKKRDLTEHMYTHTGEKPFQCEKCYKCFRRKRDLTRHMTDTNNKSFMCVRSVTNGFLENPN